MAIHLFNTQEEAQEVAKELKGWADVKVVDFYEYLDHPVYCITAQNPGASLCVLHEHPRNTDDV